MGGASELETARALAVDYTEVLRTLQAMAVAEDHAPNWSELDTAKITELEAEHAELGRKLAAVLTRLADTHGEVWRTFLSTSVARLPAESYAHVRWSEWLEGTAPDDPAAIFARGIDALARYTST